ncbi:MAG: putative signal transducing protein [Deltaproteobacteria bacterium]
MLNLPDRPEVLLTATNEFEAAAIIGALAEYEIEAFAVGAYTSGYVKTGQGLYNVDVVVRHSDADRARRALAEIRDARSEIDWSTVEVGETDEPGSEAS